MANASLRVHAAVATVQVHPAPDIAVAVNPTGNTSTAETVPVVGAPPLLETKIV